MTDLADIHIEVHDSGLVATHNYPCPVCQENHAVYDLGAGIFQPCWICQAKGWQLHRVESRLSKAVGKTWDRVCKTWGGR